MSTVPATANGHPAPAHREELEHLARMMHELVELRRGAGQLYPTLAEAQARFLGSLAARSERTHGTYKAGLRYFNRYLASQGVNVYEETAEALTVDALEQYLAYLRRRHRGQRHDVTIRTYIASVRAFFRYLILRHLAPPRFNYWEIRDNLQDALGPRQYRAPRVDQRAAAVVAHVEALPLPDPASRRGAARLEALRDKALMRVLFCTGARREEVSRLNRSDVRDGHADRAIVLGKGGKDRLLFLDATAQAAIRAYLEARADEHAPLFLRHDNRRGEPGRDGEAWRLSCQGIWWLVRRYGAAVGVQAKPHHFRHLKATSMLNRGAQLSEVQDILGHASPETTKLIYAHYSVSHLREAFDRYSADVDDLLAELEAEAG